MLALIIMLTVSTFTFQSDGKAIEGYAVLPPTPPKALVLYFHRGIEDRNAVKVWADLMAPRGYAVAGYTATSAKDVVTEAKSALANLQKRKELARLPVILMGASLGTRAAARLFVADPQIHALVLIVPGSTEPCKIPKQEKRPIFLVQAEKDEVVGDGEPIHRCLPSSIKYLLLKETSHRFPPSQITKQITDWLDSVLSH